PKGEPEQGEASIEDRRGGAGQTFRKRYSANSSRMSGEATRRRSPFARNVRDPDMPKPDINIHKLSPEERLDLIEELSKSPSGNSVNMPVTNAQSNELDRRLEEMNSDA